MCGINGIFAYREDAPPVEEAELLRSREAMIRRGPDGAGHWISPDRRIGLGHRRLAIIDLSDAGVQPMATADGRLRITFNGEIYNYRELRRQLEASGYVFRSQSDTEVLLHLYDERGPDMVRALRGMFAFAIRDDRSRSLFLARDSFGIKPLYYADDGNTFRFASQAKALLAGGAVVAAPEPAGSVGFLLWGFVPEPYTIHRGVRALPAGTTLRVGNGSVGQPQAYFSVRETLLRAQDEARPFASAEREALGAALRDSVRRHLVSDVPVAAFLSAGVDSSLVATLAAAELGGAMRTLTLGFREYAGGPADEVPLAERIAAELGTKHESRWIGRDDFADELAALRDAMDQPTTDGVNTYLVCREAARAGVKVALSGLGGDELFGGYPSFRDVPRLVRWLRVPSRIPHLGRAARVVCSRLPGGPMSPKLAGLLEYGGSFEGAYLLRRALHMPWELRDLLDAATVHVGLERLATLPALAASMHGLRSEHARVCALELTWYMRGQLLRDADWAGMAHAVEVRVPLVDVDLFRFAAPLLVSGSPPRKADMAACVPVPLGSEIVARPKSGFSVPVRQWIADRHPAAARASRGLRGWAVRVLPEQPRQCRVLALVSDAYGAHGGIAKFNRDFLSALAALPQCAEVVVLARHAHEAAGIVPAGIRIDLQAATGKWGFVRAALAASGPFDLVIAAHIHFSALAALLAALRRARSMLVVYGIDAWTRSRSLPVRLAVSRMDTVAGISRVTLERFARWSGVAGSRLALLPCCVDLDKYGPGPKPDRLARELGLAGRTVLMTLGRLEPAERYKGFDEVIESLPWLAREVPDVAYLICGEGADRDRLAAKAQALDVGDRVVFAGFVPEDRKADFYRLADAFVMPSTGEGFAIVLVEALASGIPVMGSLADAGRETLQDGALGVLVDPARGDDVRQGILRTLRRGKGVPEGLAQYSEQAFRVRVERIVGDVLAGAPGPG